MADFFVSQSGAGSTDGSSPANAQAIGSVTWSSHPGNDVYLLGLITTGVNVNADATEGNEIVIRGDGATPGVITVTGAYGILFAGDWIILKNITVTGCSTYGIKIASAVDVTGSTIDNCEITDNVQRGISYLQSSGTAKTLDQLTITDSTITGSGYEGIRVTIEAAGAASDKITNLTITGNTITGNGGTLYAGIRVGDSGHVSAINETLVIDNNTVSSNRGIGGVLIIGFTDTSYVSSFSGNTCNGNLGVLGGMNIQVSAYFTIENNTCNNNEADEGIDGHGLLIDDGCDNIICRHNSCSGNVGYSGADITSGAGIMVLSVTNGEIYGNLGTGNRIGMILGGASAHTSTRIYNNTFVNSTHYGFIAGDAMADDVVEIKNNIFTGDSDGFYVNTGTDQTDEDYNIFYGFDTPTTNHTLGTNTLTSDPLLDANYKPTVDSPAYEAGIFVSSIKDYQGRPYHIPPTIGAYEFTSGFPAQPRTSTNTRIGRFT